MSSETSTPWAVKPTSFVFSPDDKHGQLNIVPVSPLQAVFPSFHCSATPSKKGVFWPEMGRGVYTQQFCNGAAVLEHQLGIDNFAPSTLQCPIQMSQHGTAHVGLPPQHHHPRDAPADQLGASPCQLNTSPCQHGSL